jgi:hypothetical protein
MPLTDVHIICAQQWIATLGWRTFGNRGADLRFDEGDDDAACPWTYFEFEGERMLSGGATESGWPLLTGFRRGVDKRRLWEAASATRWGVYQL